MEGTGDSDSFLFNLTKKRHFPHNNDTQQAIYCKEGFGFGFAGGSSIELGTSEEPYNGDGNCYSEANNDGFKIPLEGGKNMLTDQEDVKFTVKEIEVWEVEFLG